MATTDLRDVMRAAAERVLDGSERAYDVAVDANGDVYDLPEFRGESDEYSRTDQKHVGTAYIIWAEISDMVDDPRGPQAEELCEKVARAVAEAWLALDAASDMHIDRFFDDWDPYRGREFRSAAGWPRRRRLWLRRR